MEENDLETRFIREEIGRCEDLEELKARIFPLLQSQQELWMQKMTGNPCGERTYEVCICEAVPREPGVGRQMVQGRDPEEPRRSSHHIHTSSYSICSVWRG